MGGRCPGALGGGFLVFGRGLRNVQESLGDQPGLECSLSREETVMAEVNIRQCGSGPLLSRTRRGCRAYAPPRWSARRSHRLTTRRLFRDLTVPFGMPSAGTCSVGLGVPMGLRVAHGGARARAFGRVVRQTIMHSSVLPDGRGPSQVLATRFIPEFIEFVRKEQKKRCDTMDRRPPGRWRGCGPALREPPDWSSRRL